MLNLATIESHDLTHETELQTLLSALAASSVDLAVSEMRLAGK